MGQAKIFNCILFSWGFDIISHLPRLKYWPYGVLTSWWKILTHSPNTLNSAKVRQKKWNPYSLFWIQWNGLKTISRYYPFNRYLRHYLFVVLSPYVAKRVASGVRMNKSIPLSGTLRRPASGLRRPDPSAWPWQHRAGPCHAPEKSGTICLILQDWKQRRLPPNKLLPQSYDIEWKRMRQLVLQ